MRKLKIAALMTFGLCIFVFGVFSYKFSPLVDYGKISIIYSTIISAIGLGTTFISAALYKKGL